MSGDALVVDQMVPITPGVALTLGRSRGILVSVTGTVNMTVRGVAQVGITLPVGITWIRTDSVEVGGTATGLWAVY